MDFSSYREHKAIVKYNRKPNSKIGQLQKCGTRVCIYDVNQTNVKAAEFGLGLTHVNYQRCFFLEYGSDSESPVVSSSNIKKDKSAKFEKKNKPAGVSAICQQFDNTFMGHLKTISTQTVYVVPCFHKHYKARFPYHIIDPAVRSMIRDMVRIVLHLHSQHQCLGDFTFTKNVVLINGTAMFSQLTHNANFTEESRKKDYNRLYCELTKLFGSEEHKLSADFKHFLDQLNSERPHAIDSTYLLNHLSLLPTVERLRVIKGYAEGVSYLKSDELDKYFDAMDSM